MVLSSFRADEVNGQVVVEWETTLENKTLGFYLQRLDPATGRYQGVTEGLLPGLLTSPNGGTYSLIDRGASPGGSYKYKLIEVEKSGNRIAYGPFAVVVGGGDAIGVGRLRASRGGLPQPFFGLHQGTSWTVGLGEGPLTGMGLFRKIGKEADYETGRKPHKDPYHG